MKNPFQQGDAVLPRPDSTPLSRGEKETRKPRNAVDRCIGGPDPAREHRGRPSAATATPGGQPRLWKERAGRAVLKPSNNRVCGPSCRANRKCQQPFSPTWGHTHHPLQITAACAGAERGRGCRRKPTALWRARKQPNCGAQWAAVLAESRVAEAPLGAQTGRRTGIYKRGSRSQSDSTEGWHLPRTWPA